MSKLFRARSLMLTDLKAALALLSARFARVSDILVQKIFRLIDILDLEDSGTVLDRINRAEKKDLVGSAREFIEIRELRNRVDFFQNPHGPSLRPRVFARGKQSRICLFWAKT